MSLIECFPGFARRPVCADSSTMGSGTVIGRSAEVQGTERMPTRPRLRKHAAGLYRLVSWLFARKAVKEAVATRLRFNCSPEEVWDHIMFYEEVPGRPAFLLRRCCPTQSGSEGDKTRVGATVRCAYTGGDLAKRITTLQPPHLLQFEVIEQRLGIEGCILTLGGSYQIYTVGRCQRHNTDYELPSVPAPPVSVASSGSAPGEPAPHPHPPRHLRCCSFSKSSHWPGGCGIPTPPSPPGA